MKEARDSLSDKRDVEVKIVKDELTVFAERVRSEGKPMDEPIDAVDETLAFAMRMCELPKVKDFLTGKPYDGAMLVDRKVRIGDGIMYIGVNPEGNGNELEFFYGGLDKGEYLGHSSEIAFNRLDSLVDEMKGSSNPLDLVYRSDIMTTRDRLRNYSRKTIIDGLKKRLNGYLPFKSSQ